LADSTITKKALATSLKELLEDEPFEKISVGEICDRCFMNRKSFYYHFKDKYDLMNWIFDTEFSLSAEPNDECFVELCRYLYDNRSFYRRAFKIQGQNSFSAHFRERLEPIIEARVSALYVAPTTEFARNFYIDAFLIAIERWLSEKNCIDSDEFVSLMRTIFHK
jgi:probable dihydroxyacetone kinase regulator